MKDEYRNVGLGRFCRLIGITRQAYYQHFWRKEDITVEHELIVKQVLQIRQSHRHMGARKLYEKLQPFMIQHQIKMGRDALFDLLSDKGLLVRKKKQRIFTTQSSHWLRKYPNLIKDFIPTESNQLWVSDITYWKISTGYMYISFITDAFSRKIVGYHAGETLEAMETMKALEMAVKKLKQSHSLIHHSDRGIQYCSAPYVKLLTSNSIKISMTENGDPLENAIAERINGIMKQEYILDKEIHNITEAENLLNEAVELYNHERPHMSIGNLTPNKVHANNIQTKKLWKNYYQDNRKLVNLFQD